MDYELLSMESQNQLSAIDSSLVFQVNIGALIVFLKFMIDGILLLYIDCLKHSLLNCWIAMSYTVLTYFTVGSNSGHYCVYLYSAVTAALFVVSCAAATSSLFLFVPNYHVYLWFPKRWSDASTDTPFAIWMLLSRVTVAVACANSLSCTPALLRSCKGPLWMSTPYFDGDASTLPKSKSEPGDGRSHKDHLAGPHTAILLDAERCADYQSVDSSSTDFVPQRKRTSSKYSAIPSRQRSSYGNDFSAPHLRSAQTYDGSQISRVKNTPPFSLGSSHTGFEHREAEIANLIISDKFISEWPDAQGSDIMPLVSKQLLDTTDGKFHSSMSLPATRAAADYPQVPL
eukprot:Lankesteria_metandrocarpae@DN3394_c0_g1_i1.p1